MRRKRGVGFIGLVARTMLLFVLGAGVMLAALRFELIPASITRPFPHAAMPLHEHCIFKNGIHLGELWYFTELARWLRAHGRNRFLLTAPPLRLPGAVGSPATPIATV